MAMLIWLTAAGSGLAPQTYLQDPCASWQQEQVMGSVALEDEDLPVATAGDYVFSLCCWWPGNPICALHDNAPWLLKSASVSSSFC